MHFYATVKPHVIKMKLVISALYQSPPAPSRSSRLSKEELKKLKRFNWNIGFLGSWRDT